MTEETIVRYLLEGTLKEKVCRICLQESELLFPLSKYSRENEEIILKDVLMSISTLQIDDETNKPNNVCKMCVEKIYESYDFRLKCEDSDEILNNCITCLFQEIKELSDGNTNSQETILFVLPEDSKELLASDKVNVENSPSTHVVTEFLTQTPGSDVNVKLFKVEHSEFQSDGHIVLNPSTKSDDDIIKIFLEKASAIQEDSPIITLDFQEQVNIQSNTKDKSGGHNCSMCFDSFGNISDLQRHIKSHDLNDRHFCRICLRSYRKLSSLKRHMITHAGKKSFICKVCHMPFYYMNALRMHARLHGEKRYSCKVCMNMYHHKRILIEHLKGTHSLEMAQYGNELIVVDDSVEVDDNLLLVQEEPVNTVREFDCSMCTDSFQTQEELDIHKLTHPKGSRHVCRICGRSYREVASLKRHIKMHTGQRPYLCTICGKSFFFRNMLKSHMVYHGEKKEKCQYCDKKFHTKHTLREHNRLSHSDEKYCFICEICGKLCSSRSRLMIHTNSHNEAICNYCGKSYKNMRYFKDHIKMHKGMVGPKKEFFCDYCGITRNLKSLLELHILSKHLKERRYKCELCDKAFFTKGSKNDHVYAHNQFKSQQCNICNKKLVCKKSLIMHQRLHSGEKLYPCLICGEFFLTASRRRIHVKSTHKVNSNQELNCNKCSAKFNQRSELQKHMGTHLQKTNIFIEVL